MVCRFSRRTWLAHEIFGKSSFDHGLAGQQKPRSERDRNLQGVGDVQGHGASYSVLFSSIQIRPPGTEYQKVRSGHSLLLDAIPSGPLKGPARGDEPADARTPPQVQGNH